MSVTSKLFIVAIAFLALTGSVYAVTPREELQQMVEQLQKTPGDSALREQLIKLAPTLNPSPDLPAAAVTFEGRAQFAFRSAKSEGDFLEAAGEYEKAVAAAPWVPGYYADLCTIYEKAGKFEDAKRHCGFYQSSLTDPAQVNDVRRRIAGLEFGIEKANSPKAKAVSQKQRDEELVRSLDGVRFDCPDSNWMSGSTERNAKWLVINGNQLTEWDKVIQVDRDLARANPKDHALGSVNKGLPAPITGTIARGESYMLGRNYRIASDRIVIEQPNIPGFSNITCNRR